MLKLYELLLLLVLLFLLSLGFRLGLIRIFPLCFILSLFYHLLYLGRTYFLLHLDLQ